jgi:hypothetical protein
MTLFGSTYVCEQLFSAMKIIKSDHGSRLNDVRLESCVRVAVSSISANIDQLMTKSNAKFLIEYFISVIFILDLFFNKDII